MSFLPRKGLLAIAAVVDVALNGSERPISARKLAARHSLPARHLEPVLQALVHEGIFNGVRGPEALARLPEAERQAWRQFWGEVQRLLDRAAATPAAGPPKKP